MERIDESAFEEEKKRIADAKEQIEERKELIGKRDGKDEGKVLLRNPKESQLREAGINSPLELLDDQEALAIVENKLAMPVDAQKNIAAKIKVYLDYRISLEARKFGFVSEQTRKWVDTYNTLLNSIQENLHGKRQIMVHLGQITHAHIAGQMRRYKDITPRKEGNNDEEAEDPIQL